MPDYIVAPYVKIQRGTPLAFYGLKHKRSDTLYFIAEADAKTGQLWLGDQLISGSLNADGSGASYLNELKDLDISGASDGHILIYNEKTKLWTSQPLREALKHCTMIGATEESDGEEGFVPAPKNEERNYFLRGDGTWAEPIHFASNFQIFQVIPREGQNDFEAIEETVKDKNLANGDIVIVLKDKRRIPYIYHNEDWILLFSPEYQLITSVSDEFEVNQGKLEVKEISSSKITNLADLLNGYVTQEEYATRERNIDNKIENLADKLNNYVLKEKYDADMKDVKDRLTWHSFFGESEDMN